MNSSVLTLAGVATLFAHLLLLGAALVLKGLALQQRTLPRRLAFAVPALALALSSFLLATDWFEIATLTGATLFLAPVLLGIAAIREDQVGLVIKKFSRRSLHAGQLIALDGEAGYQAETLPPGVHFGYTFWQFRIVKSPVVIVAPGEIALVIAAAGAPIPPGRILGRVVACDNFQDARRFLLGGGEKGRQLALLTAGTYRINRALFEVITADNATHHGIPPSYLELTQTKPDQVGIVTTLDGHSIEPGEIAGPVIPGHDNFQNAPALGEADAIRAAGTGLLDSVLALVAREKSETRID